VSDYREFQDGEVVPGTRYRVTRLIGTGGMGRVYEVEHQELGKRFVLKALLRELSRREDLVMRLRNEWRALARLEHPNIVGVTDAGNSDNGVPFYVMERLEGETLSALLHRQRRLLPQQALTITAGILSGLHAAHQIGVVHRDVKPPNIFVTTAGAIKVLDFGIAKIKDANGVITARGIAVGTPRYMSPEQAQGSPVDARSDIYSTGLMLFEMLSGVGPFDDAKDHNELLLAHLGQPAPLLSSICVVAPELDAMVAAMLAKDPRERPGSAHQVALALLELGKRYASFVATDAPTVNVTPRPGAPAEPTTRLEGIRRPSQPAPATRPEAPAARGRDPETVTTVQPALEVATTAAQVLLPVAAGGTLRLTDAAPLTPGTYHGPDTLVDPLTRAPTAVPEAAPERTELLLAQPLAPGARAATDPGPTRTAVPLVEPNLTPPPVVPAGSLAARRAAPPKRLWPWFVAAGVAVGALGGATWLWRGRGSAVAVSTSPGAAARSLSVSSLAGSELEAPAPSPPPATPPSPSDEVAAPTTARSAPPPAAASPAPSAVTQRNESKNSALEKQPHPAPPTPSGATGKRDRPRAAASMPGSGL
jgi:eukaryotic-like serine/threonine-protein kinase